MMAKLIELPIVETLRKEDIISKRKYRIETLKWCIDRCNKDIVRRQDKILMHKGKIADNFESIGEMAAELDSLISSGGANGSHS
jgi:hypothetical protein